MSKRSRIKFPKISAEVKERETHSREVLRKKILSSHGLDRWHAWQEKRDYGSNTRHLLLAYGMIRGVPYKVLEKKTENWPSSRAIATIAKEHGHDITLEMASAWLTEDEEEAVSSLAPAAPPAPVAVQAKPSGQRFFGSFANFVRRLSHG